MAPTMPKRMVTTKPPGSRSGVKNLATAPTINPKTIPPTIPTRVSFQGKQSKGCAARSERRRTAELTGLS